MSRRTQAETLDHLAHRNIEMVTHLEKVADMERTQGERLADRLSKIIGSWAFIVVMSCVLGMWIIFNIVAWAMHWDPYPFILLNLMLSFQAAFASPVIMMSQNRQARLADRWNRLDLQINMLSEQENTQVLRLLRKIAEKNGITMDDVEEKALEQDTKPENIVRDIERAEKNGHPL